MVKNSAANSGDSRDKDLIPGSVIYFGVGNGNLILPGKFNGQRNLVGYSSWGHKESDMTKHTHSHTYSAHDGG